MYEPTPDDTLAQSIDLAQELEFDLGSLRVRPAKCEVESDGSSQILQRRVMQVLVALAHARGAVVSQEDLVVRCWRGLSVSDDAIFRCISMLRKMTAGYPNPPFTIETIPGVGYRLTSSDVDDPPVAPTESHDGRFHVRAWAAAAVISALLLLGTAIWIGQNRAREGNRPASIAVMPFEALGGSEQVRSLARRIPNEVVNQLGDSQVEAALRDGQASGTAEPRSGLVVTGIVRGDGSTTSVNVRIEDAATNAALWAREFRRSAREASDLPLEIAARLADETNMILFARGADPPLSDNSALSALLQVTDMIRDPPDGAWAQMVERAQGLVSRNPRFAFGHDVLAVAYAEAAEGIDVPERARTMKDAARREAKLTLQLDREDAGAYVILSDLEGPYDYSEREEILQRGISLARHPKEPLGGLYSSEGRLLDSVGRLREALSWKLTAQAADEWGAPKTAQLARAYANMGNLSVARAWLQKGVQLWPNHSGIRRVRQYVAGFYEPPSEAVAVFDALDAQESPDQGNSIWRSYVQARAARSPKVTADAIDQIRGAADQGKLPREIAIMMMAGLGESRQAIDAANAALQHEQLETWFLFTPVTRNLRQDPGFAPLVSRLGLVTYWRNAGKLPDFCTDPRRISECNPQLRASLKS